MNPGQESEPAQLSDRGHLVGFLRVPMGMERATNSRGHPNSANDSFMRVYEI